MIISRPLVSICIPTFNRASYLKNSFDSLLAQPETKNGLVEVVISDNASTDETENLCKLYAGMYECIKYYRNPTNYYDKNFPIVIGRGQGVLRKLSNDNLIYKKGSLRYICNQVIKYQHDKPLLFFQNGKCNVKIRKDQYLDFNSFMRHEGYLVTQIMSYAFWDSDCTDILKDFDGTETKLWQVKKMSEILATGRKACIIEGKLAEPQKVYKKDISYGVYEIFYLNFYQILFPYVNRGLITYNCLQWIKKNELFDFFTYLIISWEFGDKSLLYSKSENLKNCIFSQYSNEQYFRKYLMYYKIRKIIFFIKTHFNKMEILK